MTIGWKPTDLPSCHWQSPGRWHLGRPAFPPPAGEWSGENHGRGGEWGKKVRRKRFAGESLDPNLVLGQLS